MEKNAPKKNVKGVKLVLVGDPNLLWWVASLLCDAAADASTLQPRGVSRLLEASENSIKFFCDGSWSDFTKNNEGPIKLIDSVEIYSPIRFFSEIVLIPYGHTDIEDREIATADLVCVVDEFGRSLHQASVRDRVKTIADKYFVLTWVISNTSNGVPSPQGKAAHRKAFAEILPTASPTDLHIIDITKIRETSLLNNFKNFALNQAFSLRENRQNLMKHKSSSERHQKEKSQHLSDAYIDRLIHYNINYAKDRIQLFKKAIAFEGLKENKYGQLLSKEIEELRRTHNPLTHSAEDIRIELQAILEEKIGQCTQYEKTFSPDNLMHFHQNLCNSLAAVEDVLESNRLSETKFEFPEWKQIQVIVPPVEKRTIAKVILGQANLQNFWTGVKATLRLSFDRLTADLAKNFVEGNIQRNEYLSGVFNNVDQVLPDVIVEVTREAERFKKACEEYLTRVKFIVDNYREKLLEKKSREIVPVPTVLDGPKKKFRILSLDGGGMRGLLLIDLLQYLSVQKHQKITESFDLICGTSTGGIIALAMGFLDLPLKVSGQKDGKIASLEQFYWELGKDIFPKEEKKELKLPFFSGARLAELLRKTFGSTKLNELHKTNPNVNPNLKIFVTATRLANDRAEPFLFRTYDRPQNSSCEGTNTCYVWEAARATSAAPTYFEEYVMRDHSSFIDGGVGANNPTLLAIGEAKALLGNKYDDYDIEVISLGTGRQDIKLPNLPAIRSLKSSDLQHLSSTIAGVDARKLLQTLVYMAELATSSESTHEHLNILMRNYVRINPPLNTPVDLSETEPEKLVQMLFEAACYPLPPI